MNRKKDLEEEISAFDFVVKAREPERTKDDFNEDNEDLGIYSIWSHLLINVEEKPCQHVLGKGTVKKLCNKTMESQPMLRR